MRSCASIAPLTSAATSLRFVTSVVKPQSAAALGCQILDDGVDAILAPRSQYDFRAVPRQQPRRGFTDAAAGAGDDDDFVGDGWWGHLGKSPVAR
jgi:hypothetical protein